MAEPPPLPGGPRSPRVLCVVCRLEILPEQEFRAWRWWDRGFKDACLGRLLPEGPAPRRCEQPRVHLACLHCASCRRRFSRCHRATGWGRECIVCRPPSPGTPAVCNRKRMRDQYPVTKRAKKRAQRARAIADLREKRARRKEAVARESRRAQQVSDAANDAVQQAMENVGARTESLRQECERHPFGLRLEDDGTLLPQVPWDHRHHLATPEDHASWCRFREAAAPSLRVLPSRTAWGVPGRRPRPQRHHQRRYAAACSLRPRPAPAPAPPRPGPSPRTHPSLLNLSSPPRSERACRTASGCQLKQVAWWEKGGGGAASTEHGPPSGYCRYPRRAACGKAFPKLFVGACRGRSGVPFGTPGGAPLRPVPRGLFVPTLAAHLQRLSDGRAAQARIFADGEPPTIRFVGRAQVEEIRIGKLPDGTTLRLPDFQVGFHGVPAARERLTRGLVLGAESPFPRQDIFQKYVENSETLLGRCPDATVHVIVGRSEESVDQGLLGLQTACDGRATTVPHAVVDLSADTSRGPRGPRGERAYDRLCISLRCPQIRWCVGLREAWARAWHVPQRRGHPVARDIRPVHPRRGRCGASGEEVRGHDSTSGGGGPSREGASGGPNILRPGPWWQVFPADRQTCADTSSRAPARLPRQPS